MKLFTKTFAIVGLLSVFLVFPKSSLASELSMDKLLNHNEDGTLKEGFVEVNPWENNFNSIPLNNSTLRDDATDTVIYTEEEAKKVFNELRKQQEIGSSVQPTLDANNYIETMALKSKTWYRTEFKAMALYAGTISLPTAGNYLYHSLQDNPSDRLNGIGSSHANALSLTRMYTEISKPMAEAIKTANSKGQTSVGYQSSYPTSVANVGLDFYLTYGKITYSWAAVKQSNNSWLVSISIYDKYNYETIEEADISSGFPQKYIDLANNVTVNPN